MSVEMTLSARERGRARLRARRDRAHRIRRSVVTFTVAAFIAVWLIVYVQMVEGKDPALATSSAHVSSQAASPDTSSQVPSASTGSTDSWGSTDSSSSADSSQQATPSQSPSPVTTSQS